MSVEQTTEKGQTVSVGSDAWFDVLDAAGNALHNMQYPLRDLELPPYPAGGTCGCANLGKALSHIVAAQEAIRDLEKQLGQWCAMTESAHGSSSNTGYEPRDCGGFCVKAGQAQFALLLRTMPERYAWHEMREERVRTNTGKDWSVLTDRRGDGKKKTLTLRQFRERIENGETFDRHDWGGCGCALDDQSLVNSDSATRRSISDRTTQ